MVLSFGVGAWRCLMVVWCVCGRLWCPMVCYGILQCSVRTRTDLVFLMDRTKKTRRGFLGSINWQQKSAYLLGANKLAAAMCAQRRCSFLYCQPGSKTLTYLLLDSELLQQHDSFRTQVIFCQNGIDATQWGNLTTRLSWEKIMLLIKRLSTNTLETFLSVF